MSTTSFPAPAELSQGNTRGSLQEPQTASGAGSVKINRIVTVKLARVEGDTYKTLRDVAAQSARYANAVVSSLMAEFYGYGSPKDSINMSQYIRGRCKGDLSGAVYSAIEREVRAEWQKNRKLIWAGLSRPPYYSADRAVSVRADGVRVLRAGEGVALRLTLLAAADHEAFLLPIERNTGKDDYVAPRLEAFVNGEKVAKCQLVFRPTRGEIHARLAYGTEITLEPVGQRTATLEVNRDGRLLLRTDGLPAEDWTHRVTELQNKKLHFEGIRKRILRRGFGRGKGDARRRRKHLVRLGTYDAWAKEFLHSMSMQIIRWCEGYGVGVLSILDIGDDGSWPAYKLKEMLRYKSTERGIKMAEGAGESAARTVKAEIRRQRAKATNLSKAIKTIKQALEE